MITDRQWFERRARNLELRARSFKAARAYFDAEGFLEVDTPLAVPSPGLDVHLDAARVDLVRQPRWLITSPEYQMKRLLSAGFERIYQLCHCFRRNEEGTRHQPEFMMLEWYRAGADMDGLVRDTEALVEHIARHVLGTTELRVDAEHVDLRAPWERLSVREAFERYANASADELLEDEERFYRVLVEDIEPKLGRGRPTILYGYPASQASLAKLNDDDPSIADRFEAYVAGVELCNGFCELTDATEQRSRLLRDQRAREELGKEVYPIDERFVSALEEGLPPCSGNALGFDRLVMLLCGAKSIEDVVAFSNARL